jgi:hypothetical protein
MSAKVYCSLDQIPSTYLEVSKQLVQFLAKLLFTYSSNRNLCRNPLLLNWGQSMMMLKVCESWGVCRGIKHMF